ncbi:MAG: TraR/DksA C4-type zinc finger protein [Bauldia sp.]|nr:TraR/DksA C4-type zinc finger protein [Bauldia sp.]MCW5717711.1 TraR/DksA C4-type zinc finger protein [Bauldia sp.]
MSGNDADLEKRFRPILERELADIERLLADNAENSAPVTLDQQSVGRIARIDAMQVQPMAKEAEARRKVRRQRILGALARMETGEFGTCASCGEPISNGRLTADPTSHLCVTCAR